LVARADIVQMMPQIVDEVSSDAADGERRALTAKAGASQVL
jgi:hypothetical protein